MTISNALKLAGCAAALIGLAATSAQAQRVRLDQETNVGGVGVGCTGIGQTKNDPKWQAYSVRLEFAAANGEYLAGESVSLSDSAGQPVLTVSCEGPWLLLQLPPGKRYQVAATVIERSAAPKTVTVSAPHHGQATFVLTFPNAH
jgi:hypothetical protein